MTILFILTVVFISLFEGIPLVKNKQWGELVMVSFLITVSVYLGIAKLRNWSTPIQWLEQLLDPLATTLFRLR